MHRKRGQGKCVFKECVFKYIFPGVGIWTAVKTHPELAIPESIHINKCLNTITNKTPIYLEASRWKRGCVNLCNDRCLHVSM